MKRIAAAIITLSALNCALQAYADEDAVSPATVDITALLFVPSTERRNGDYYESFYC